MPSSGLEGGVSVSEIVLVVLKTLRASFNGSGVNLWAGGGLSSPEENDDIDPTPEDALRFKL